MNGFMDGSTPGRSRSGPDDEITSPRGRPAATASKTACAMLAHLRLPGHRLSTGCLPADDLSQQRSVASTRFAALAGFLAVLIVSGCGGGGQSDDSTKIGTEIGGTCTATAYAIIGRLDHTKSRIYDCYVGAKHMCVTEENGIASDQTEVVRLLFQNSLSGGKPDCAI